MYVSEGELQSKAESTNRVFDNYSFRRGNINISEAIETWRKCLNEYAQSHTSEKVSCELLSEEGEIVKLLGELEKNMKAVNQSRVYWNREISREKEISKK